MQTENLKCCGIASCDVNNPFSTFACWFCVSNGNVFSPMRVKECPEWHFWKEIHVKGVCWIDAKAPCSQGSWLGFLMRAETSCSPQWPYDFAFCSGYDCWHHFSSLSVCGNCTPFSYPHCCSSHLGYKIQQISVSSIWKLTNYKLLQTQKPLVL